LILNEVLKISAGEISASAVSSHRGNAVFRVLSTKLSTGDVDNRRKSLVYWHLAQKVRYYINFMLRCMICRAI
jgi:hypothetical protein